MTDYLDWLDYVFLVGSIVTFSTACILIWRWKPYRQYERKPVEPTETRPFIECPGCGAYLAKEHCWCKPEQIG